MVVGGDEMPTGGGFADEPLAGGPKSEKGGGSGNLLLRVRGRWNGEPHEQRHVGEKSQRCAHHTAACRGNRQSCYATVMPGPVRLAVMGWRTVVVFIALLLSACGI